MERIILNLPKLILMEKKVHVD